MTTRLVSLLSKDWRVFFRLTFCLTLLTACARLAVADDFADQISHARLFAQPLVWVGTNPPSAEETYELYQAAGLDEAQAKHDVIRALEAFAQAHSDSAWAPSLEANLARYYRSQGRYSLALLSWEKAWQATKGSDDLHARMVADYTVAEWTQQLSSLGRVDELSRLVAEVNGRQLCSPEFQKKFDQARMATTIMKHEPGLSYRCGTLALYHVAQALKVESDYSPLLKLDSPTTGFSLARLMELSAQYQLGLVAVKRPAGDQLVVPSVVHWNESHYAAIVAKRDGAYEVIDPTFGHSQWLTAKTINENASGYFMVPTNLVPRDWQAVSSDDAKTVFGKGIFNGWFINPTGPIAQVVIPAQRERAQIKAVLPTLCHPDNRLCAPLVVQIARRQIRMQTALRAAACLIGRCRSHTFRFGCTIAPWHIT